MDITGAKYYAELTLSGHAKPIQLEGSIAQITQAYLTHLKSLDLRANKDGKTINLRVSSEPLIERTMSIAEQNAKMDKELGLDPADIGLGPEPGESYEDFHRRLRTRMTIEQASFFANDWFDRPQDPLTTQWMLDPKIRRFNMINASSRAYAEALPSEYESLKQYIKATYPAFAERINWRTAY